MNTFYSLHVCRLEPMPLCVQHTFEKMGTEVYLHMWGPSEFSVMGTLKQFDIINKLKNITVPVLLACGEFDEATPEATRFYQQNIPNSEMVVFKDASHMHHIEKEDEFLKILRDFLHKNE
jgi:proline iminopeptidase